jgi:cytochrome c2
MFDGPIRRISYGTLLANNGWAASKKRHRAADLLSGECLKSHADSAHGGEVLDSCPACHELKAAIRPEAA